MTELSDREIEQAAREAGISPMELREAMQQRGQDPNSGALVPYEDAAVTGLLPPSPRGRTVDHAETSLPYAPEQAIRVVKDKLEQRLGFRGHMQGGREADIYDEDAGLVYRLQADTDGGEGSLVRVDIDPTPMRNRRALMVMGFGSTMALFAAAGLVLPGLIGWALLGGTVGLGALGIASMTATRRRAIKDARSSAASALIEAEQASPLGPASDRVLGPGLEDPEDDPYAALEAALDDDGPRALPPSGDPSW